MNGPRPIAFYAPLKSPDDPSPSGDRTMARLLLKALREAGFPPIVASHLRTHDKAGDGTRQEQARRDSFAEAERLIAHFRDFPEDERPILWFTYHVYYKAPDWIGPLVAGALDIPYVVAEGSRAAKRADGPWSLGHKGAEEALDRAGLVFSMTDRDRPALEQARPRHQKLVELPPFIDEAEWSAPRPQPRRLEVTPRLLAVAMMRHGDKLESYRILAEALTLLRHLPWSLDIVGDGEARAEVEAHFAPFTSRTRFHGMCDTDRLRDLYGRADLLVWPAVNEAYGMVLLEAQLFGNAVVAGDYGGVRSVVKSGETGILAPPGDVGAFARSAGTLIRDAIARRRMGEAARTFVHQERNLAQAAARLHDALVPLTGRGA